MAAIPTPSLAGDQIRWNNRNYIAVDELGTLIWEQDHSPDEHWYYVRDWSDLASTGSGRTISNRGYFEFENCVIQAFQSTNTSGQSTHNYNKTLLSRPSFGAQSNDIDQTDTEHMVLIFGATATSVNYTNWAWYGLPSAGNANLIYIGEQASPSVTEYDQLPLPAPVQECDHNGRHLYGVSDGSKVVWDWNFRAYAVTDNQIVASKYMKIGNLLINVPDITASPAGPKTLTWAEAYDPASEPVVVGSAVSGALKRGVIHYFDYPASGVDDHLGISYKQFTPAGSNSTVGAQMFAMGPMDYPYQPPLRWPVPSAENETFHYRGRDYIATDELGTLIWEMDPAPELVIDTEFLDGNKRLDVNGMRIIGGQTDAAIGLRITTFPFSGFAAEAGFPKVATVVDGGAGQYNLRDWVSNQGTAPTTTDFQSTVWEFEDETSVNAALDYLAIGTTP